MQALAVGTPQKTVPGEGLVADHHLEAPAGQQLNSALDRLAPGRAGGGDEGHGVAGPQHRRARSHHGYQYQGAPPLCQVGVASTGRITSGA